MPREINSVAVAGGGLMERTLPRCPRSRARPLSSAICRSSSMPPPARVEKSLADAVKRGKVDQAKRDEVLARITFTPDPKDVASSRIRGHVRLVSAIQKQTGLECAFGILVELEGSDRPACVIETVVIYR